MSHQGPSPAEVEDGREDTCLGRREDYTQLPAPVDVQGQRYFLVSAGGEYRLLSKVCPHMGGCVVDTGAAFECPTHGWKFERESGRGINVPRSRLASFPVFERGGELFAKLPSTVASAPPDPGRKWPASLRIRLVAHACLEIVHDGFTLLTDPWLFGPAFLGSWIPYPPPEIGPTPLRPDAIWISHEHSDHFHEPTLQRFDRSTPVLVPDFPNRRMVERLSALGFTDVRPMPFGARTELAPDLWLTTFEPGSYWNDAILLVEAGGARILNINDAGLNHRIASQVGPVDILTSAFSWGASGYPLTWGHLDEPAKVAIIRKSNAGLIHMLKDATALYGARYLLPFAGYFALGHPSHRDFVRVMERNTPDRIVTAFQDVPGVQVIDLLPGESWDTVGNRIERRRMDRDELFRKDRLFEYLDQAYDPDLFAACHPVATNLTSAAVEAYFLRLNDVPEMAFCEDLTVEVTTAEGTIRTAFEVKAGSLRVLDGPPEQVNLSIQLPAGVLERIVSENDSWDEAHIGYWCRFSRSPDVYHAGFWRLLQAPYFKRPPSRPERSDPAISDQTIVADLLERHGGPAERILGRYGLYCTGCSRATWESIGTGARNHGLDEAQTERLVRELEAALPHRSSSGAGR